jgi:hypothetical protein
LPPTARAVEGNRPYRFVPAANGAALSGGAACAASNMALSSVALRVNCA